MRIDPYLFLQNELNTGNVPHSGRSLLEHLTNVEKILRICKCDESVCLAGLYHSIYGTSMFRFQTTNDREQIRAIIGERAEYLAWIFCSAKRPFCWLFGKTIILQNGSFIAVDDRTLHDLHMIESANMIEQHGGLAEIMSFATRNVYQGIPAENPAN
jgi:hypothetical protein